jgi:hypothetical protein
MANRLASLMASGDIVSDPLLRNWNCVMAPTMIVTAE